MKILNQINYVSGLGADRWIGNGFKDAFEELGHEFHWLTAAADPRERLDEVMPDITMIGQDMLRREHLPVFAAHRRRGMKLVVRVDSFFDRNPEVRDAFVNHDPADLYYGEVENPWMDVFKKVTGKPYHVITNAAHRKYHFPAKPIEKYECDIVFLGAMMPHKREAFRTLLFPLKKKYRVKIYGSNWTAKDNLMRLAALAARKVGLMGVNDWVNELRLSVPPEEENQLYASAKISLNIHERGESIRSHVILNERTFKIPASGGFEICDWVPPLRNYFTKEEMVMADNAHGSWVDDWFRKIDYYITHEKERRTIQERGTARALRDHTYLNRVRQLLSLLGFT